MPAPKYPSMEETRLHALKHAKEKRENRSQGEYIAYMTQMAMVRESAQISGIEEWTRAHTIGGLFACQAIRSSVSMLRSMGVFDAVTAQAIVKLCLEQEIITVQMEENPEEGT